MDEETRYTIQLKVLPVNGRLQHFPVQNQTLISLLQQGAVIVLAHGINS